MVTDSVGQEFRKGTAVFLCSIVCQASARKFWRLWRDVLLETTVIQSLICSHVWWLMLVLSWDCNWAVIEDIHMVLSISLGFLTSWWLSSRRESGPREPGKSCITFCDLVSEVISLPRFSEREFDTLLGKSVKFTFNRKIILKRKILLRTNMDNKICHNHYGLWKY